MKNMLAAVLAASFLSLGTSAAFADCVAEIEVVQAAFENADLDEAAQDEVSTALDAAMANQESGDEDSCLAAIDEAKAILNID